MRTGQRTTPPVPCSVCCAVTCRLNKGSLVPPSLPTSGGLPVLHSGTAPHAGHASSKSGPSGERPDFDTPRASTGNPFQELGLFLHSHSVALHCYHTCAAYLQHTPAVLFARRCRSQTLGQRATVLTHLACCLQGAKFSQAKFSHKNPWGPCQDRYLTAIRVVARLQRTCIASRVGPRPYHVEGEVASSWFLT